MSQEGQEGQKSRIAEFMNVQLEEKKEKKEGTVLPQVGPRVTNSFISSYRFGKEDRRSPKEADKLKNTY